MLVHSTYLALLLVAAGYDLWRFRIPNLVTGALAVLFLVAAVPSLFHLDWLGHLGAFALVLSIGAVLFYFRFLGGGDVKLFAATALWLGLDLILFHVVYVAVIGLVLAILLLVLRRILVPLALAYAPDGAMTLPRTLRDGEPVPYGVAIAVSAILLSPRLPEVLWLV